ncbi:hypothetical protein [Marinicella litoralis]|uniref:Imelysin n=1 Tax=Marinicella litoralis TaxID=644220 RepID=A0A4R6XRQ4_9GAMM|nr:hypothetical protein [Marinicella litoralis]TDR22416.1 hypothetical protein C8D91_0904 [Marinicella litoralis]
MYKIIVLAFILTWYGSSWAEPQTTAEPTESLSAEQLAAAEDDFSKWFNQLNEHLINSNNSAEKVMGLAAIINATLSENNQGVDAMVTDKLLKNLSDIMNEIINQDDLSETTLDMLASWCFRPKLKVYCDHDALLDKQLKGSPDNLNVYLMPLNIALEQQDQTLIMQIIGRMSEAKRSHHSHYITPEFSQMIDQYIAENPIPTSYVAAFKDDKALLSGLSLEKQGQADALINAYFPTSIKMSYVFLNTTPAFRPLYQVCQSNKATFVQCLQITQILINQSNSLIARGVGYATLMAMHESRGKADLLKTVGEKHEAYKAKVQCLSRTVQTVNFIENFLDPAYQKINLQPIDELERKQQLAEYVYNKYKDKHADLKDPKDC